MEFAQQQARYIPREKPQNFDEALRLAMPTVRAAAILYAKRFGSASSLSLKDIYDELVAEGIFRVYAAWDRYVPGRGNYRSFVYNCVSRRMFEYCTKYVVCAHVHSFSHAKFRDKCPDIVSLSSDGDPDQVPDSVYWPDPLDDLLLNEFLDSLRPRTRLYLMELLDGYPKREVTARHGIDTNERRRIRDELVRKVAEFCAG